MTPDAVRASMAAHLVETLDVHPHLAAMTAQSLSDRLTADGWEINTVRVQDIGHHQHHEHQPARPVAPRARETLRVLDVHEVADEETPTRRLVPRRTRTDGATP
ncbi:hypothetical protein [Streptomyces sp. NPDC054863]